MKKVVLTLLKIYQKYLSLALKRRLPLSNRSCRFLPTCSQYTYEAILRYGIIRGTWRGLCRLLRCHPFSQGGFDPLK